MKRYDYVIWDFNGTILDDVDAGIRSVNTLLDQRGLERIPSVEYYKSVFRFPIIDYYRRLGFDFDKEPYEAVAPQWVKLYLENVKSAELYGDVKVVLERIKEKGIRQTVLSATEINMLIGQLDDLGISEYFDDILGLDNIHAGSKLSLAYDWRIRHSDANALLIGDTDHDAQTAQALGADCVLVARGHQSKEYLLTVGSRVIDDLGEIIDILNI